MTRSRPRHDPSTLTLMDKWILSKLQTLIKTVDSNLENYHIAEAARALGDFVDELSNWYVRRCRERFWGKGMEGDKLAAFDTLYNVLVTLTKLCAPFVPFMAESMYQNLVVNNDPTAPDSVHLCDFPVADESLISSELEDNMERVILACTAGPHLPLQRQHKDPPALPEALHPRRCSCPPTLRR